MKTAVKSIREVRKLKFPTVFRYWAITADIRRLTPTQVMITQEMLTAILSAVRTEAEQIYSLLPI